MAVGCPAMLKTKVENGDTSRTNPVAFRANVPWDVACGGTPLPPKSAISSPLSLYPDTR